MPSRWLHILARTATILLLCFLLIFVALRVAAPYVVSTRMVRTGIENALSEWTGYRAQISGHSELEFWPTPRITIHQIAIRNKQDGNRLLGTIDTLSAEFSIVDAILGHAKFHEFHLLRPSLSLHRDKSGLIDWTNQGLLSNAIGKAHLQNGSQVLEREFDASVGRITVEDGTFALLDITSGRVFHFESVSADIDWRRLSRKMDAVLIARSNGQDFKVNFSSAAPLLLFAGKNADMNLSISSALLTSSYRGTANILSLTGMDGHVSISIPDLPALSAWADRTLPGVATLKSFSLEGDVQAFDHGLRFDSAALKMNDASATGAMDISFRPDRQPRLGGTLAFDLMNLRPLLDAFTLRLGAGEAEGPSEGGLLQKLDIDLRLSAKQAQLDVFNLQEVAASVIVSRSEAKLEIGDARFEGGDLIAHLDVTHGDFDGGGKLQINIRNTDLAAVMDRLHPQGPIPLGRGSIDIDVQTSKAIWLARPEDLSGTVDLEVKNGTLPGIDVDAIRSEAAAKTRFFPLNTAASRAFAFDTLAIKATIKDGAAELDNAQIIGPSQTMSLSGLIPYASSGLALTGSLTATDSAKASEFPPLPFFIGGSWPKPVMSPAPANEASNKG